ncbi:MULTISPECIES: hypothetical protein [unclassified Achromobacter]|uniref:hypothetical protein n=1 Tax=unclassified Achromobacter TaxID=2626865 RepID=UPI0011787AD5|nr:MULTISPECIES: hypothetical protein [unclassified Achromobacter]
MRFISSHSSEDSLAFSEIQAKARPTANATICCCDRRSSLNNGYLQEIDQPSLRFHFLLNQLDLILFTVTRTGKNCGLQNIPQDSSAAYQTDASSADMSRVGHPAYG